MSSPLSSSYRHCILPFVTRIRQQLEFWNQPLNEPCYLCHEIPFQWAETLKDVSEKERIDRLRPYPILFCVDRKKKILEVWEVVCRTCFINFSQEKHLLFNTSQQISWCSEYRMFILQSESIDPDVDPEPSKERATTVLEEDGQTPLSLWTRDVPWTGRVTPPLWSLKKFGGTLDWLTYNDPKTLFLSPTSTNRFENCALSLQGPWTVEPGTIACWGCGQWIKEETYLPVVWDFEQRGSTTLVRQVTGCFHTHGRCAKAYLLRIPGHMRFHRLEKTEEFWWKHKLIPHTTSEQDIRSIVPLPEVRLFESFGQTCEPRWIAREEAHGFGPPHVIQQTSYLGQPCEEMLYIDHHHYDLQLLSEETKRILWKENLYQPLTVFFKDSKRAVRSDWKIYMRTQSFQLPLSKDLSWFSTPSVQTVKTEEATLFLHLVKTQRMESTVKTMEK